VSQGLDVGGEIEFEHVGSAYRAVCTVSASHRVSVGV